MKRNALAYIAAVFATSITCSHANPTGGSVAGGAATINSSVPGTVTINQTSNLAIINWSTFSIAQGETTSFIQPSAASATLNRVMSTGGISTINGTLNSIGAIYLINGNGILIGPSGVVNANGFTASTRDIADNDFLSGNLHFTGNNSGGVQNFGVITGLGGNVYLIGKTVDNEGTINAPNGTAGLVSGDDVYLAQQNSDGSTVTVNPSQSASSAASQSAVKNGGTITAMNAELQAANGNLYALAINNGGTIRASSVSHQGGHIYLTSVSQTSNSASSGNVVNSGTLDASGSGPLGQGGTVSIKNYFGTTTQSGTILAKGGQGGSGGQAEILSKKVNYTGQTDLTAPGGATGTLTIGTQDIAIQSPDSTAPVVDGASVFTTDEIQNTLATANVFFDTDDIVFEPGVPRGTISVNSPLAWNSNSTLVFGPTQTVFLNGNITAPNGGIGVDAVTITSGSPGAINPAGVTSNIVVNNFVLFAGSFVQNSTTLPLFQVTTPLVLGEGGLFLRSGGGSGTTSAPYHLVDAPGVEGIPTFPAGTVYVIDFNTPPPATITVDTGSLMDFASNTANSAPTLTQLTFNTGSANANSQPGVDDTDEDGSAVNGGKDKKSTSIASGSSTASIPSPSRLLTAGSGINTIFNGGVMVVKPPPFVTQELDAILNPDLHGNLSGAAFGNQ
jgi:filamentous hemagglutinin family protein